MTASPAAPLRLGTRGSTLALRQSGLVVEALARVGIRAELVPIVTAGDVRAPDTAWGEGAFVGALEAALLDGRVDLAVHSAKDVPTDADDRLTIAAFPTRTEAVDVLVGGAGNGTLADLPVGAIVGTDSPRRTGFLLAARRDLRVVALSGNVDTRLGRLDRGEVGALVLAAAGLLRLGRGARIASRLDPEIMPPAPGQGALAIQTRTDDHAVRALVGRLDDPVTRLAVETERTILAAAGGGCRAPLGALVVATGDRLDVVAGFVGVDGRDRYVVRQVDSVGAAPVLARAIAADFLARGYRSVAVDGRLSGR